MRTHGPSCWAGPILRDLDLWSVPAGNDSLLHVTVRRHEGTPIRRDLVDRVRREIAAGTYDTPERLEAALLNLIHRIDAD